MNDLVTPPEGDEEEQQTADLSETMANTLAEMRGDAEVDDDAVETETRAVDEGGTGEVQCQSSEEDGEGAKPEETQESAKTEENTDEQEPDFSFAEDSRYMNSLKPTTRSRLESLLQDRNKHKDALAELNTQVEQQYQPAVEFQTQWTQALQSAQMDNNDVQWMLTANRLMKSGDYNDAMQAAQMVDQLKAQLDQRLGRGGADGDPLANHPDLQEKVQRFQISREDAIQIATYRNQEQAQQSHQQLAQQQDTQRQQYQQVYDQAANTLTQMEQNWQATDTNFAKKQKDLVNYTNMLIQQGIDPRKWPQMVEQEYNRLTEFEKRFTSTQQQPRSASPQPIRPTNSSAASQHAAPKDMNDALTQELERMRG